MTDLQFDLYHALSNDAQYLQRFESLTQDLEACEQENDITGMVNVVGKLLELTNHNLFFLMPYLFPRFEVDADNPSRFLPFQPLRRPFLLPIFSLQPYSTVTIRGSRQIGKSVNIGGRLLGLSHFVPFYQGLYIAPKREHITTFSRKILQMEAACRYQITNSKFAQNLYNKKYPNGSAFEIMRLLYDETDVRGKTVDDVVVDESQNMDPNMLPVIRQTQRVSKKPTTVYLGTSLTQETTLEQKFQESTQSTWFVRAGDGRTWLNCGDPETALAIIQPQGPTCPITSRPLDMSQGRFIAAFPERARDLKFGYHIPQIIVDEFTNDPLEWYKLYQDRMEFGDKRALEEILGIPTSTGAREINEHDLINICTLGSYESMLKRARSGMYRFIVSSLDWGGTDEYNAEFKDKVSFTVHALLGARADSDMIDILHMRQYSGMDYEEICAGIVRDHTRYGAQFFASDRFGGQTYRHLLHRGHNSLFDVRNHFVFGYTNPEAPFISRIVEGSERLFGLNRTDAISRLFLDIKGKPPKYACYDWEQARDRLTEFRNMYRAVWENKKGRTGFRYQRHATRPDDTLHAVVYGTAAIRILRGERLSKDPAVQEYLRSLAVVNTTRPDGGGAQRYVSG